MFVAVWSGAMDGKRASLECCLKIMERRSKLL
jgi:hypothetical protein